MTAESEAPRIGVVADDLTGACDVAAAYLAAGHGVRVATASLDPRALTGPGWREETAVAVVDTDSRSDPPRTAYRKVRAAVTALREWGARRIYKKVCSAFRGNIGPECDALLDGLALTALTLVAAFPQNGRATEGGVHTIHGRPLALSEFASDPIHPATESNLVVAWQAQTQRRVGLIRLKTVRKGPAAIRRALARARAADITYTLCDAVEWEDVRAIGAALADAPAAAGAGGLAEALVPHWLRDAPQMRRDVRLPGGPAGVLVVAGSITEKTRAQIAALERRGAPVFTLDHRAALSEGEGAADRLALAAARAASADVVVLRSENSPAAVAQARAAGAAQGLDGLSVSRLISTLLARGAAAFLAK
ncbi:MAG TPA: four-carbon acid sugar kinase family protein, partial [Limnochordia bacterium]